MLTVISYMTEDLVIAQLAKGNFTPIAMGKQVLHGVETCPKTAIRFPKMRTLLTLRLAGVLDARLEGASDERGGCVPSLIFGRHVFLEGVSKKYRDNQDLSYLHSSIVVKLKLPIIYWRPEFGMELASVAFLLCITPIMMVTVINHKVVCFGERIDFLLRIVDMFLAANYIRKETLGWSGRYVRLVSRRQDAQR